MLETVVTLGLLFTGLISFEGMEIMMQRGERRAIQEVQLARQQYEAQYVVQHVEALA